MLGDKKKGDNPTPNNDSILQQDQIGSMMDALGGPTVKPLKSSGPVASAMAETVEDQEEEQDEPTSILDEDEGEGTTQKEEDTADVEEKVVAEELESEEEDEGEEEGLDINHLLSIINEQSAQLQQLGVEPASEQQQQEKEREEPPQQQQFPALDPEDIATEEDYNEAFRSRKKFNEILNRVHQNAVQTMIQSIPQVVAQAVAQQTEVQQTIKTFFDRHAALKPVSNYVIKVIAEVESAHPDWVPQKILDTAADKAYEALRIKKRLSNETSQKEQQSTKKKTRKARFAKAPTTGAETSSDETSLTDQQKQMHNMLSAFLPQ